jgi:hypothetical protein
MSATYKRQSGMTTDAAEKAMNRAKLILRAGAGIPNPNLLALIFLLAEELHRHDRALHDHGWSACWKRRYFLKRAQLIIKRARTENFATLGEHEERVAVAVLERRLIAQGKRA